MWQKLPYLLKLLPTVPGYDVSYPTIHENKHSSVINEFKRSRRSVDEDADGKPLDFGFGVHAFGRSFNLALSLNKGLLAPKFKLEVVRKNGTEQVHKPPTNCHYVGKVKGGNGSAAVSNCDGLVRINFIYLCLDSICYDSIRFLCFNDHNPPHFHHHHHNHHHHNHHHHNHHYHYIVSDGAHSMTKWSLQ